MVATQNMFRTIVSNAEAIRIKVSSSKTTQICVSDSFTFKEQTYFFTTDGQVGTKESMKILGFNFRSRSTCNMHVEAMRRSAHGRYWLLIHMKQYGFSEEELLKA